MLITFYCISIILCPRTRLFKFQDPLTSSNLYTDDPHFNEIPGSSVDKRQVSFFNFRPSKLLSQSLLKPSKPIGTAKLKPSKPVKSKTTIVRPSVDVGSSAQKHKFGSLDPVFLLPQSEVVARPVRKNRFRPPPQ